jgi:hypothetical protein
MAWPVSARFAAALTKSHKVVTRIDVLADGEIVDSAITDIAGHVAVSSTGACRRQCDVGFVDSAGILVPAGAGDLLAPFGNELALWRGIAFTDNTTELAPLGLFRISKPVTSDGPNGLSVAVTGYDRSRTVARAKLTNYQAIAAGTPCEQAITGLISPALPATQRYSFVVTGAVTPAMTLKPGDDRWAQATAIAASAGCIVFFDQIGTAVLLPRPDPTTAAAAAMFVEGQGALLDLTPTLDEVNTFNHVVIEVSATGGATPIRAEAVDLDPASPTYIGDGWGTGGWIPGPYGDVVNVITTSLAGTQAQADLMAAAELLAGAGLTQTIPFTGLVHPHLDAFDVVGLARARARIGGLYMVDTLSVPLDAATAMTGTTRAQQAAA